MPPFPAALVAPPLRARLKAAAEHLAVGGGVAAAARARMRGAALVLAWHGVVPDGEPAAGERSLHVARRRLAEQLDALLRTHDVVPLAEVLAPARGGRPRAALTFDDAYAGAVTAGVAELAARGLPATFFAVPAMAGADGFWWDALVPPGAEALPPAFRAEALDRARGRDAAVRALARSRGLREHPLPPHARPASLPELRAAARVPGISIASHSWSHPNLARLSAEGVEDEIRRPLRWLGEHLPSASIPWLSYPYGRWTAEVARAAEAAGYAGALRVEGGWVPRTMDPWALPRVNVPAGLSARGLALRAAGLLCG
ncbi:MAG TPA: polysaccharide deacetylase family protein [Longimicrobium sp.]|nr:polysaccharide deacetylase family protein [Longimicrobium sp.]